MPVGTENIVELHQVKIKDSSRHLKVASLRADSGQGKQSLDNERITELLPMVPKVASRVITYLKPPLSFEDLVAAGVVGLVKAAKDYNPSLQTEFKTYAYIRIRGAILDELKSWSFVPSNLTKQIQKIVQTSREITEQTGSEPSDERLAEKLGITVERLYETFSKARAQQFISIDEMTNGTTTLGKILTAEGANTPEKQVEKTELINKLSEAILELPVKKRRIILLYYQQHLTMKQIAEVLNITESRVSQLHASALFNLSLKLRQWKDGR